MGGKSDLIGQRFGRLEVTAFSHTSKSAHTTYWVCRCDCGNTKVASRTNLRTRHVQSCGCYRKENSGNMKPGLKHGKTKTLTHYSWKCMRDRCYSKGNASYKYYGGKGIKVCDRWLNSFECFLSDMGERPSKEFTLDRIDPFGDYEPSNCRWLHYKDQANNRRRHHVGAIQQK